MVVASRHRAAIILTREAHGCPEKMSRVNQSVAAHAPQNKGTR
jgi:hypothetical protein